MEDIFCLKLFTGTDISGFAIVHSTKVHEKYMLTVKWSKSDQISFQKPCFTYIYIFGGNYGTNVKT